MSASNIRIVFALVFSLVVHALLLGLGDGMQQAHPVRSTGKKITFHLTSFKPQQPVKKEQEPIKKKEPEIIKKVPPEPVKAAKKPEQEVVRKVEKVKPVAQKKVLPPEPIIEQPVPDTTQTVVEESSSVEQKITEENQTEKPIAVKEEQSGESAKSGILDVVMARPLYRVNPPPPYPAKARRRNLEGTVILEVAVSAKGEVETLQVKESCGHRILDRAALSAVKNWVFEPGSRDGIPVSMTVLVPVRFALE